jgi:molybdopterin-guanine dinucleotide biosynthesis protein A
MPMAHRTRTGRCPAYGSMAPLICMFKSIAMEPRGRSAIVLAGGRSLRMGADKATLPWGGVTMLEWVVAELSRSFEEVVVVAGVNQRAVDTAARMLRDSEPFEGPVKALRLGLSTISGEVAFACPCDLPFINAGLALALCDMAADRDAAIPLVQGRLQVLHAAYRKSCLPELDAMIQSGERALRKLTPSLDVRCVNEDEVRRYDPELLSFFNVNTPEDYARAQRLVRKSRP